MTSLQPILPLCVCGDPLCRIPYGYCHCKCGGKTRIAVYDDKTYGYKKGLPRKFLPRHHRRIRPVIEVALPFKIDGMYCRLIPLGNSLYTIVDVADYEWLMQWKWWATYSQRDGKWRVVRDEWVSRRNKRILMSRQIAAISEFPEVDHDNGNTLDNRRGNLRPCTRSQNNRNKGPNKNNKTGIKGVTPVKDRFKATIYADGILYQLGYFDSAEEAGEAYWEAAKRLHGRFAKR